MLVRIAALFSLICVSGFAASSPKKMAELPPTLPWLTGPLIAPPQTVVPVGHFEVQPYLTGLVNTGVYNEHWHVSSQPNFYVVNPLMFILVGITEWMDFQMIPSAVYNATKGVSSFHFQDLPVGFDFQLISPDKYKYIPGIKFSYLEVIPTGKYQKLDPAKKRTDVSGEGSYASNLNLIFYKVLHFKDVHYLSLTLSLQYIIATPVPVKGFNTYGGGLETRGKAYPGNFSQNIFSFEYTFTENWVFALDNVYTHVNKSRFSGHKGFTKEGQIADVTQPSSEQFSLAPGIEYNFNENWGLIGGFWFSVFGRNSSQFESAIISFLYNY